MTTTKPTTKPTTTTKPTSSANKPSGDGDGDGDDNATQPLSYKAAGVDIAAADAFVSGIAALAASTRIDGVVPGRSEYASLFRFRPALGDMRDPLLAATCDGVGTKLVVAREMGHFAGLGQDLVAMNVNDLLPVGARPLFFLDYIATGKLDVEPLTAIVGGIAAACRESGCALLGGETAEMPGVYPPGEFDLAGFAVGIVDGAKVPDTSRVAVGDRVIALPSSGVHSNGLSLARKALFERGGLRIEEACSELGGRSVGETLLEPTRLYVRAALRLLETFTIHNAAHVTGGGLLGRSERLLLAGQRLHIDPTRYERPPIFDLIARTGGVPLQEMARTFNMGLGYLVILDPDSAKAALQTLAADGWRDVGEVVASATSTGKEKGVDLGYAAS